MNVSTQRKVPMNNKPFKPYRTPEKSLDALVKEKKANAKKAGAAAYRQNITRSSCPFGSSAMRDAWYQGFDEARGNERAGLL